MIAVNRQLGCRTSRPKDSSALQATGAPVRRVGVGGMSLLAARALLSTHLGVVHASAGKDPGDERRHTGDGEELRSGANARGIWYP